MICTLDRWIECDRKGSVRNGTEYYRVTMAWRNSIMRVKSAQGGVGEGCMEIGEAWYSVLIFVT
jgi:hypothetical protein